MLWKTTLLAVTLAIAIPSAATPDRLNPLNVPPNLTVPAGFKLFLVAAAEGTQNYICLPTSSGVAWSFIGPQATLFGGKGEQLMTHFLSGNPAEHYLPRATWQDSRDTSAVWATAIASSSDPAFVAEGAIPWLLLRVVGTQYGPGWGDRLTRTAFIQRVNTAGGLAPADGCGLSTDIGKRFLAPYTTDYLFDR